MAKKHEKSQVLLAEEKQCYFVDKLNVLFVF